MVSSVRKLHKQLSAGSSPILVRFPNVRVLIAGGVIGKTARSGRDCLYDRAYWCRGIADHALGLRIAVGKDAQAAVSSKPEFHWDTATAMYRVEGRRIRDWAQET